MFLFCPLCSTLAVTNMNSERFSRWKSWLARESLNHMRFPGVYALAISTDDLSDQQFTWLPQIVYFGMTNSISGLKGRLKQFDNTINGKTGHGGADRFRHDFPQANELHSRLYVAILPFECDVTSSTPADLTTMGSVAKAEYECFAQYSKLFGHLPKYNDKKNSPKFDKAAVMKEQLETGLS